MSWIAEESGEKYFAYKKKNPRMKKKTKF